MLSINLMKSFEKLIRIILSVLLVSAVQTATVNAQENSEELQVPARKILFIGDSMTGWLSERLQAYGRVNDFDVSTVVWDGSTIQKWGKSNGLRQTISNVKPDAVFICLGMNDLFEANPESRLGNSLNSLLKNIGDIPVIWVGPPSWPGHNKGETLNKWLADKMGEGHFFRSFDLKLQRQSAKNPHPSRAGMIKWGDALVDWLKTDGAVKLPGYTKPGDSEMTRGKTFIYKKMKEPF